MSDPSMRLAVSVSRKNLISLGTCLGKFGKGGKFKLHITALDYLAQYAKYKVFVYIDTSLLCFPLNLFLLQGLDKA
jgi:ribosome biogenesis protein Nip4